MPAERVRMAVQKLHIEPNDGSPPLHYRIERGQVERRTVELVAEGSDPIEVRWKRLTPEQLASEIVSSPVFARWLSRRAGVHSLIRACCHRLYAFVSDEGHECRRHAGPVVI
jgi:hypothetical protein